MNAPSDRLHWAGMEEPTLRDVQREFPEWVCQRDTSGLYSARQGDTLLVGAEDPQDLKDMIIRHEWSKE